MTKGSLLLVDGEYLKKKIEASGTIYTPAAVHQFLYHTVKEIQSVYDPEELDVKYFGYRPVHGVSMPISKTEYTECDMKQSLHSLTKIADVPFKTHWGRSQKYVDHPWIMKEEAYEKTADKLTDADFILDVQRKGVLTQLVNVMAEETLLHKTDQIFIVGDEKDLRYATGITQNLNTPVNFVDFQKRRPVIASTFAYEEAPVFNMDVLKNVPELLSQKDVMMKTAEEKMQLLREDVEPENQESLLLVDAGVLRVALMRVNAVFSKENVEKALRNIKEKLPEEMTHTIFYYAHDPKSISNPKRMADLKVNGLELMTLEDAILSYGQMYQSEECPSVLHEDKWMVPHKNRKRMDFDANIKQYDVDDRIIYDMALARCYPNLKRIYLLASDSDFVIPVNKSRQVGQELNLIQLEQIKEQVSMQLKSVVNSETTVDLQGIMFETKEQQDEKKRHHEMKEKLAKRKKQKKGQWRTMEPEDISDMDLTIESFEEKTRGRKSREKNGWKQNRMKRIREKNRRLYGR